MHWDENLYETRLILLNLWMKVWSKKSRSHTFRTDTLKLRIMSPSYSFEIQSVAQDKRYSLSSPPCMRTYIHTIRCIISLSLQTSHHSCSLPDWAQRFVSLPGSWQQQYTAISTTVKWLPASTPQSCIIWPITCFRLCFVPHFFTDNRFVLSDPSQSQIPVQVRSKSSQKSSTSTMARFSGARFHRSESRVSLDSEDGLNSPLSWSALTVLHPETSSSRKYSLAFLVGGIILASVFLLALILTTVKSTAGRRKQTILYLDLPSLMNIFSSRCPDNGWRAQQFSWCEGGSVQY